LEIVEELEGVSEMLFDTEVDSETVGEIEMVEVGEPVLEALIEGLEEVLGDTV